jgi:hypothetical protein
MVATEVLATRWATLRKIARVAELADAPDLGSGGREAVGVRVSPLAPPQTKVGHGHQAQTATETEALRRITIDQAEHLDPWDGKVAIFWVIGRHPQGAGFQSRTGNVSSPRRRTVES